MPNILRELTLVLFLVFCYFCFSLGCGSTNGVDGGAGIVGGIQIVIEDPNAKIGKQAKDLSLGKAVLTQVNPSSCTLTISASDMSTVTKTFNYTQSASVDVDITPGTNRTISVECSDPSGTTNNIPVGFEGSTTADLSNSDTTVTLRPSFKNLIPDDADGIEFLRINQETGTQTLVTFGFGSALTDAQKGAMRCVLEFDATGNRTSLGVIDASQSAGLKEGAKADSYMVVEGGVGTPACFVYDKNEAKALRATGSWATNDDGNTEARCKFGITQTKNVVDSNQKGQIAAACSLTGTTPYDSVPDSGYARYDLSSNSIASDISGLTSDGGSCTPSGRGGEVCTSGWCLPDGTCGTLDAVTFSTSNLDSSDFAGAPEGCGAGCTGSTDGTGTAARFASIRGLTLTPDGKSLYVADSSNHTIRKVVIDTGVVTTVAGAAGTSGTTDGTGTSARFNQPFGMKIDPEGIYLYISEILNHTVRRMEIATSAVTTFAGAAGTSGNVNGTGTSARFNRLGGITIDSQGKNMYVVDTNNHSIRQITLPGGVVTTLAGTGSSGNSNGIGTGASFNSPSHIVMDATGTYLYVTDRINNLIRRILISTVEVTTLAGSGAESVVDGIGTDAAIGGPSPIAIDPTGSYLYVGNNQFTIQKIDLATGQVTSIAGLAGTSGNINGSGTAIRFGAVTSICPNHQGTTLYGGDSLSVGVAHAKIRRLQ